MKSSVYVRRKHKYRSNSDNIFLLTRASKASIQLLAITWSPNTCVNDKVEKRKKASETDDASEGTVINSM